jgi:hypothetical protein
MFRAIDFVKIPLMVPSFVTVTEFSAPPKGVSMMRIKEGQALGILVLCGFEANQIRRNGSGKSGKNPNSGGVI